MLGFLLDSTSTECPSPMCLFWSAPLFRRFVLLFCFSLCSGSLLPLQRNLSQPQVIASGLVGFFQIQWDAEIDPKPQRQARQGSADLEALGPHLQFFFLLGSCRAV